MKRFLLIFTVLILLVGLLGCNGGGEEDGGWPTSGVATILPTPQFDEIEIRRSEHRTDDDYFSARLTGVTWDQFVNYVEEVNNLDVVNTIDWDSSIGNFLVRHVDGGTIFIELRDVDGVPWRDSDYQDEPGVMGITLDLD